MSMVEDVNAGEVDKEEEVPEPSFVIEVRAMKEQLMQMDKEQLAERLAVYEVVIPKLGPMVRWCIDNFYRPIFFRFRVGRENVGFLVGATLIPESFLFLAEERVTKYEKGKSYEKHDIRMIHAPVKELSYYDVVLEEGEWEEMESAF